MRHILLGIILIFVSSLACSLSTSKDDQETDVEPASTDNWVSFQAPNVSIGAPPNDWLLVPTVQGEIDALFTQLNTSDTSVANVFLALSGVATSNGYHLILMKRDGTAWATVYSEPLPSTYEVFLTTTKEDWERRGIPILSEREVNLPMGKAVRREFELPVGQATRWQDSSSTASQALDRQYQYLLAIGTEVYTLTFDAQAADFNDYKAIFQAMAFSFSVS
ncbi:MAG: hypothetical protein BroJett018_10640 [Chloroflexota bacterium]|nr:hypothetical protein [Chloroflexota bacterium]NOG64796.1 hypothetical protein [Chloroflexota bacterium]GIK63270.1 MAG: hypothetical protein BroJett018_10640 [Chloroflexota bacterium]